MLQRFQHESKVTHLDALRWATDCGAKIMRRSELVSIAQGIHADLALFKPDKLSFCGHSDPLAVLVICVAHHADRVMISERWIVKDCRILGLRNAKVK